MKQVVLSTDEHVQLVRDALATFVKANSHERRSLLAWDIFRQLNDQPVVSALNAPARRDGKRRIPLGEVAD